MANDMESIDLRKIHRQLYRAKETPEELVVPAGCFLAVDGKGTPGGDEYQASIGALYGVAYTMKFALKAAGVLDYAVSNLECLWYSDPTTAPSEWEWRIRLRVPDAITDGHVAAGVERVREKREIDATSVRRVLEDRHCAVQVLHVGPYDTVSASYRKLISYADARGLKLGGVGHEVYLSDPRRTPPQRLRTIVRLPLA